MLRPAGVIDANKSKKELVYRLKGMAAVRILAEVAMLLILVALPLVLLCIGQFFQLMLTMKIVCIGTCLVSLLILPFYGRLPYKVQLDDEGIRAVAVLGLRKVQWQETTGLTLKTSWGWRRYVVTASSGELSFPMWMTDLKDLVEAIRQRLPNRGYTGASAARDRIFRQDPVSLAIHGFKLLCSLVFIAVFWTFALSLVLHGGHGGRAGGAMDDHGDALIIVAVCLLITVFMLIRCFFMALMPATVVLKSGGLLVESMFFKREYGWEQVKSVRRPWFFLPEGILIFTQKGLILIGDQLDAFDELQEELSKRVSGK
jgi:hypothetical protein